MASPPLQGRARVVMKPQQNMRGGPIPGPLARPGYVGVSDLARSARSKIAEQIDRHPETRRAAYRAAHVVGGGAGVVRGVYHMAKGLGDAAVFGGRVAVPGVDQFLGRKSAEEEALELGARVAAYVAQSVRDPEIVRKDIGAAARAAKVALLPSASPAAASTSDELARRFAIGMNQGEVGANVVATLAGGPLAKVVGKAGEALAVRPVTAAKYVGQGYTPAFSEYLAEPYVRGMASHWVPRRFKPPAWFVDSAYNKLQPPGIQRGEMLELHGVNDLWFNGANPPKRFKGEAWSFKKSGLKKNGPLGRIWHGAPGPMKARAGGLAATAGSGVYAAEGERD